MADAYSQRLGRPRSNGREEHFILVAYMALTSDGPSTREAIIS